MASPSDLVALRAAIVARHGTVYRFWARNRDKLCKSTVYTVLAGKWPANPERILLRIRAALEGLGALEEEVLKAIKATACARCSVTARPCARCDKLFTDQARAACAVFSQLG